MKIYKEIFMRDRKKKEERVGEREREREIKGERECKICTFVIWANLSAGKWNS